MNAQGATSHKMPTTQTQANNPDQLTEKRRTAAEASGGDSSGVIHGLFETVVRDLALKGDLLDFGAGKGFLATRLHRTNQFNSVTAVDLVPPLQSLAGSIGWISADLNEPINTPNSSFDVIVAAEVIEHLENPRALAREWFRLLRPGGTLVLSTPNNESLRSILALIFQGHFALFGPSSYPAHITPLLRRDIHCSLTEAGLTPPRFLYTNDGVVPKTGGTRWQMVSGGLLRGVRYSDNLMAICSKISSSQVDTHNLNEKS